MILKTKNNEYLAGGISPGLGLRYDSISQKAFLIDKNQLTYPESIQEHLIQNHLLISELYWALN